ncbi:N-formylglutamate amidohydrolase [Allosphingosinicella flava]|uniref:N-formylglutamate amidohydrolase n=1 Tax=Allosphingosinicella flava TaxID=2771430 RepID=A0A7T2GLG7_9SPHN|nr:N-formylglutamate amidohydrolase [Sphingosinicella flava]QPQ56045.1 N-formylglutamate amidohydrolase [Sphingosinicella flava]
MADRPADGDSRPFRRVGPEALASPVILSVPHAGRRYSDALIAAARIPLHALQSLEDRLVDRLVWRAVAAGATALIAEVPRAEIDLNRHEREMDPLSVASPLPHSAFIQSARTKSGLGLVPSRHPTAGAIWRHRLSVTELEQRIASIHRPFHAALAGLLEEARGIFGVAILLDCHSMPPRHGRERPDIVFGDRHGTSMGLQYRDTALSVAARTGFRVALNTPYAGGHITVAHGRPGDDIHALQIEIDRSLYLDAALKEPGPGFDRVTRLIAALADALAEAAIGDSPALAAE